MKGAIAYQSYEELRERGFSKGEVDRAVKGLLREHQLPVGSALENRVTLLLHKFGALPECEPQYRVGRYRLDYAWPRTRVCLEVDGPHHWQPDTAVRDRMRDSELRAAGWLTLWVDDQADNLAEQVVTALQVIRAAEEWRR